LTSNVLILYNRDPTWIL